MEASGQLQTLDPVTSGKKTCTHRIGSWVVHRVGLELQETRKILSTLSGFEPRTAQPGA